MISIIIPAYNVEKYISRCVDSILAQTIRDWELLLIDDGSSDQTGAICDRYAASDGRIRVFHQENSGVSAARNFGIEHSDGEYLIFLDSDDWTEPDMLEKLLEAMLRNQSDIAACDSYYARLQEDHSIQSEQGFKWGKINKEETISGEEALFRVMYRSATLWNKLLKREKIGTIRFNTEMSFAEDTDFLYRVMLNGDRVTLLPYAGYHYFINRPGNVQTGGVNELLIEYMKNSSILYEMMRNHNSASVGVYRLHVTVNRVMCKIPSNDLGNREYKRYYAACRKYAWYPRMKDKIAFLMDSRYPFSVKRKYCMMCVSPYFYALYRKKKLKNQSETE